MGFFVDFVVKRGGRRQSGVEVSYRYKGSSRHLSSDVTDNRGEVRTSWDDIWNGREIEVFFDGGNKRIITMKPRDGHSINLPGGCFPLDTPVLTPSGFRPLGSLAAGDWVLSHNEKLGGLVQAQIIERLDHEPQRVIHVRTRDGLDIQATANHRLLTARGYIAVADLKHGDRLIGVSAAAVGRTVERISLIETPMPVSNLIVAEHFNFIAHGCVAHCFARWARTQRVLFQLRQLLGLNLVSRAHCG